MILVSHERATMDRLAHRIICMAHGCADVYTGGYTRYLEQSKANREAMWDAFEKQRKEIEAMETSSVASATPPRAPRLFRAASSSWKKSSASNCPSIRRLSISISPMPPPSYREVIRSTIWATLMATTASSPMRT